MNVASCADSSSELRPPSQLAVACRRFPRKPALIVPGQSGASGISFERRKRRFTRREGT
jgi:hypothetical protein